MKNSDELKNPVPNFAWYQKQSRALKLPPRCPFASVKLCPRYFRTLWLFGEHAVVERISSGEAMRLEDQLDKSSLFSREFQPQPELTLSNDHTRIIGWNDCCPEIAFDAYGVFAASGSFMDKGDKKLRHAELKIANVQREDWRWNYFNMTPAHFTECHEYSILTSAAKESFGKRTKGTHPESVSPKRRWEVLARDNYICRYCGRKPPEVVLQVDHIDPRGGNNPENLITACQDCNLGKSNRVARKPNS